MTEKPSPARSFGGVADAYDRGRPGYPEDAVRWLVGDAPATVLELGAGTGKLTRSLVELGHDVHATEPDEAMLAILRRDLPDVRTSATPAEEIPAADGTYDVVVAAQCFHWFDADRVLAEVARVLKPRGRVALVWNERDERIPWVRKLGRIISTQEQAPDPTEALGGLQPFTFVEDARFKHWQVVDRRSIRDLAVSRSNLAVLDEPARERVLADLLALYDDYGRGMDGMQLPYQARCFRASLLPERTDVSRPADDDDRRRAATEPTEPIRFAGSGRHDADPPTDDDSGTLLIDFR